MQIDMIHLLLASACSFIITYAVLPSVIDLAYQKNLFDTPNNRKVHTQQIPSLGGIGIFIGVLITFTIFVSAEMFTTYKFILTAYLILFFMGLKDDLVPMEARKKLAIQILAALILVQGGIQITTLHGFMGIHDLPVLMSYLVTVLFIVGVTNAFNLIDGIDGLAGGIGGINCVTLGFLLYWLGEVDYAILGFAITGSLLAFLRYNFSDFPNKTFMGDAGSLLLGLTITILSIQFMESPTIMEVLTVKSPIGIVAGIIFIPVFDTCRVFIIRLSKGLSPFTPDKNHIHHAFLSSGLNHKRTSLLLYLINFALICTVIYFKDQPTNILVVLTLLVASGFVYLLIRWRHHYRTNKVKSLRNELKSLKKENLLIS